jgi:hypothetical protein
VHDAPAVQVVQRVHQLARDGAHHGLRQAGVVLQDLEQLAVRVLGDHHHVARRLKVVQQQDDVGVVQRAQDRDLRAQRRQVGLALARLGDELERHKLARVLAPPLVHLAEGALADALQYVVRVHACGLLVRRRPRLPHERPPADV